MTRALALPNLASAPAAPLARSQLRPLALGRPRPVARRARAMQVITHQSGSPDDATGAGAVPSSRRSIVPLPATASRSLPPVASHAIGFAESRHGTRSPGFGACGKTERAESPNPLMLRGPTPETAGRPGE